MSATEAAYDEVERLVNRFKALSTAERRNYNEAATRQAFILPLFRALEWNIDNTAEVSPEEKVSRGWVDYSFRLGGIPRFFLETKKIAEDLTDPRWVKQAMDYAWSKSVTWALLSDFEGLRVFNAEWKEDNPLRAQFVEFGVDTYLSDFERLWWLSRPETLAGTLDHEAEKVGKKARRQPVSQHLFDDLKSWRHDLFTHLRAYNRIWSPAQIDEAVLRILNRLIFIRAAEDREVEPRRLQPLLRELQERGRSGQLLNELKKLFREFDATYDSELFARHFSDELDSESKPFETLIEGLYGKSYILYNFNAIDADVLGTAYEQYLGHVIADPDAAEVVEKRAKRKSQGIYYTPTFVVKYIVQQTLGRYLEEHGYTPSRPMRVLDMACGSGSFLIEAFDVLDRHVARMRGQAHGKGEDVLDYARRIEILTQCIYGVDKDEQAVAVACLNLLLKALHAREKLPMLENIRAGDSLISGTPDELKVAFGPDWKEKKPFNWETEFPEAMRDGGFDVIVGNPPYVNVFNLPVDDVDFYQNYYKTFKNKYDLYGFFIERAIRLLREGGQIGFITSRTWFSLESFVKLRQFLLEVGLIIQIGLTPSQTFADATVETAIVIFQKESEEAQRAKSRIEIVEYDDESHQFRLVRTVPQNAFLGHPNFLFNLSWDEAQDALFSKLSQNALNLGQIASFSLGIKTADNERFVHDRKESKSDQRVLRGRDIYRYRVEFGGLWLRYIPDEIKKLHGARPRDPRSFLRREKIVLREISRQEVIAAYDTIATLCWILLTLSLPR